MIRNYKPDEASGSKKISMIRKRKMANRDNEYLLVILLSFNIEKIEIFMRPPWDLQMLHYQQVSKTLVRMLFAPVFKNK